LNAFVVVVVAGINMNSIIGGNADILFEIVRALLAANDIIKGLIRILAIAIGVFGGLIILIILKVAHII
jgi:hypothetical protein